MPALTQAQLDEIQTGALLQVDPSVCASGYSLPIGGCLPAPPKTGGISWSWILAGALVAGIGWYFRAEIMQFVEAQWPR